MNKVMNKQLRENLDQAQFNLHLDMKFIKHAPLETQVDIMTALANDADSLTGHYGINPVINDASHMSTDELIKRIREDD